jgi:hypothetical protein
MVTYRAENHVCETVLEVRRDTACYFEGETGLPDPTGTRKSDQPHAVVESHLFDGGYLASAPDETSGLVGK